jgi:hypothetical protein
MELPELLEPGHLGKLELLELLEPGRLGELELPASALSIQQAPAQTPRAISWLLCLMSSKGKWVRIWVVGMILVSPL